MKHWNAALPLVLALGGCLDEPAPGAIDEKIGQETRASLGGDPDTDFPNVCVMHVALPEDDDGNPQDPIACTCTLVEAQTVLTSARCVNENVEMDMVEGIEIRFGSGFEDGDPFAIDGGAAGITIHRYFDPAGANLNELALIRLADAPAPEPVAIFDGSLADSMGDELTLVGFGVTVMNSTDTDGVRNFITTPITSVGERHVFAGTDVLTTCAGDSGGPGFLDAATDPAMAVMTARQGSCTDSVQRTRLDLYTESFLYPFIDRYSGACPLDGDCVETGCRSPDPDCDPCLWQGGGAADCQEDCPSRDWDCELGSFVGEACGKDGDCEEGGRCVTAVDDESFTYCSRPCGGGLAACPNGMECSEASECTWIEPSPGSPGATCNGPEACRSGVCECGVCQVQAGAGVCTQGGGGFCAVGGGDSGSGLAPLALLALAIPLALRRRRRRTIRR